MSRPRLTFKLGHRPGDVVFIKRRAITSTRGGEGIESGFAILSATVTCVTVRISRTMQAHVSLDLVWALGTDHIKVVETVAAADVEQTLETAKARWIEGDDRV